MKINNLKINKKKIMSLMVALGFILCPTVKADKEIVVSRHVNSNSNISESRNDYSFNDSLKDCFVVSQTDRIFDGIPYRNYSIHSAGCGPTTITNAFILAFNIPYDNVKPLLFDVIALDSRYNNVYNYMIRKSSSGKVSYLNDILNKLNGTIVDGGSSFASGYSSVKIRDLSNDNIYIFGTSPFNREAYPDLINMAYYLYNKNIDTNIIIYNVSAGKLSLERAFGSLGKSGHYVTLLINPREFVENNSIYIIDSVAKNLQGESNHNVNYNFVEKPNFGNIGKFNDAFDVTRISEQVLRINGKDKIDKDTLCLLGIEGGCGFIICPNNLQKDYNDIVMNNKTK